MFRKDLYALQYAVHTPQKRKNQFTPFFRTDWITVHIARSREGASRGYKEQGKQYRTAHPYSAVVGAYVSSGQIIVE